MLDILIPLGQPWHIVSESKPILHHRRELLNTRAAILRLFRLAVLFAISMLLAAPSARAQSNLVLLISAAGDYVGAGQTYYTTQQVDIAVSGTLAAVTVQALGFTITFSAPAQSGLAIGQYSNVVTYPNNGSSPGLSAVRNGRSCTNVCGNFTIYEIQTNSTGQVVGFWATFLQHCECGNTPPLTGEVRYDSLLAPGAPLPRTLRVPTDYPTVQSAMDDASTSVAETVLVGPETYFEHLNFNGKALTLISEQGPEVTVLDGGNRGQVILAGANEGPNSVVGGFTIQNGSNFVCCGGGGGIWLEHSSPTIVSNVFRNNQQGPGVAAAIWGDGSSPLVSQNLFVNNNTDGGNAVCFDNDSFPLVINNIFVSNPCVALCIGLPAFEGAAVVNNTIVGNAVGFLVTWGSLAGDGIYANNLLAGNGLGLDVLVSGSPPTVFPAWSHNLVFGPQPYAGIPDQTGTNGNIDLNPFLACQPAEDFHLLPGSPCIDAGTNLPGLLPIVDFGGGPRILAGATNGLAVVDMGAYEFDPTNPRVPCLFLYCPSNMLAVAPAAQDSAVVNFPAPSATPGAIVSSWPPTGSAFPVGDNTVNVTAVSGTNLMSCAFTITVRTTSDFFGRALGTTNATWTSGGDAPWFVATMITHRGVVGAVAQSGLIAGNQTSTLEAALAGPGVLSFWWGMQAVSDSDALYLTVNGSTQAVISGNTLWQPQTVYLGAGPQVVEWTYSHPDIVSAGQDAGWLDQVSYTPGAVAPFITAQPANLAVAPGLTAALSVTAAGTPPLAYQWLFNGETIVGATNASLAITNVQAPDAGTYSVVVTNPVGTVLSGGAELTLSQVAAWGVDNFGQTNLPLDLTNVIAIAGGWHHSVALKGDGTVTVWGDNNKGQTNVPANLSNVVAIASRSGDHIMALRADGRVAVWGDNSYGQTNVPAGLSNVVAIAAGGGQCVALKADGTAVAWGYVPTVPAGLSNIVAIAAGDPANLFLRDDETIAAAGTGVPAGLSNIVAIAAGGTHYLALRADSTVVGWGDNSQGQLNIPAGLTNVVAIGAGDYHSIALRADGTVAVWGSYANDDVPYVFDVIFSPAAAPAGLTNVVAIAPGSDHDLALLGSGPPLARLYLCCPPDIVVVAPAGQGSAVVDYPPPFATPGASVSSSPPSGSALPVGDNTVNVTAVSGTNLMSCAFTITVRAAADFSWALGTTNVIWTSGGGAPWFVETAVLHEGLAAAQSGAITNNRTSTLQTSLAGPGVLDFWWKVSSETNHDFLYLSVNGSAQAGISGAVDWQPQTVYLGAGPQVIEWTYSKDASGSAGQDAGWLDQVSYTPGAVAPFIAAQPASLAATPGQNAAFSVTAAGTPPLAYQWQFDGQNLAGATNASLLITNVQAPNAGTYSVVVTNPAGTVVSAGATLRLVEVLAWGADTFGQTDVPLNMTNVIAIAGGWHHSVALRGDGTVAVWGDNNAGQTNVPSNLTNAVAISSRSGDHIMALRTDGTVTVWGGNFYGQTNVPAALSNVVAIAAGGYQCLVLKADGTAVCWGSPIGVPFGLSNIVAIAAGDNANLFLLDNGTVAAAGTGVPAGLSNIVAIAAGGLHYLALRQDGTVVGWGGNAQGQASIPAGLTNVVAIGAGDYHSIALTADGAVSVWGQYYNEVSFFPPVVPAGLTNPVAVAPGSDHDLALFGSGPPLPRLEPLDIGYSGGLFSCSVPTQSGRVYRLEYKNSLADAAWTALPLTAGNGRVQVLSDGTAAGAQRFYRVRRW